MTHNEAVHVKKALEEAISFVDTRGYGGVANIMHDALELLKEQEAKQPVHVHEEFKEHDWYRKENGEIDKFAIDEGYHNGPMCKRCHYSFCMHCDPNGWNEEPCVIDKYKCPRCEKQISKGTKFCKYCGQAVKWNES